MNLIDEFMARYSREFDYYQQLARMCQQQCEIYLEQSGVRAMATARAKHHGRLRAKLIKRNSKFPYENLDKIYEDIVDLAGVRIALYFPGDSNEVDMIIRKLFDVIATKVFPEQGEHGTEPEPAVRFSGYHAKHYRVRLKEENLNGMDKRYAQGMIEIQVASVLMHAWSEVNHDLVYKPLAGNLSSVELNMLDNLNGLVIAGEVSLETLQQALKERVSKGNKPFSNHFELAAFLYDRARKVSRDQAVEPLVGRVDILYYFLDEVNLNNPEAVESRLADLLESQGAETIAQRLIDDILSQNPDYSDVYLKVKREAGEQNPYGTPADHEASQNDQALGRFLKRWGHLEGLFHALARKRGVDYGSRWNYGEMRRVASEVLEPSDMTDLGLLLKIRSDVVHGEQSISNDILTTASDEADRIAAQINSKSEECHIGITDRNG
jgi:ppGpp synthetase/RelA/SpoT-type nucleotidyltranferase